MHPSNRRAHEILAETPAREAEHAAWLARHSPEDFETPQESRQQPMIYKVRDDALVRHQNEPPPPQGVATMTPEQQRPWDSWVLAHLYRYFESVGVDFVTTVIGDERERTAAEIATLRGEVSQLRADLNIARALLKGEITEIGSREKRNVA